MSRTHCMQIQIWVDSCLPPLLVTSESLERSMYIRIEEYDIENF